MVSVMAPVAGARARVEFDLERQSVRELNQFLHGDFSNKVHWTATQVGGTISARPG